MTSFSLLFIWIQILSLYSVLLLFLDPNTSSTFMYICTHDSLFSKYFLHRQINFVRSQNVSIFNTLSLVIYLTAIIHLSDLATNEILWRPKLHTVRSERSIKPPTMSSTEIDSTCASTFSLNSNIIIVWNIYIYWDIFDLL